jgi:hypothetical protein
MPAISLPIPSLKAVRQRVWELVIDLLEHVDLTDLIGTPDEMQPIIDRKIPEDERETTLYACACLHSLCVTTTIGVPGSEYVSTTTLFERVEYSGNRNWFSVLLNSNIYREVRQLQEGIRLLRSLRALTPRNLTLIMRELDPVSTYELRIANLPRPVNSCVTSCTQNSK